MSDLAYRPPPPEPNTEPHLIDLDGNMRDNMGRKVPHQLGFLQYAKAVPGLIDQFITIPAEVWAIDATEEGAEVAVVSCPCTETPVVGLNGIAGCECGRFFVFDGEAVRAANRPGQYAETPVPS